MNLQDIRIIDISRLLPGPLATKYLAEQGAHVTKLDSPGFPDAAAGLKHLDTWLNAAKKRQSIAYETPAGRNAFLEHIKSAHVLVESFRPGRMEDMGYSYMQLKEVSPSLMMLSIRAFPTGHPLEKHPGHDLMAQAAGGLLTLYGTKPSFAPFPVLDYLCGQKAAFLILSALTRQDPTHITLSLYDVAMELAEAQKEKALKQLSGSAPEYNVYECSDGKWIAVACVEKKFSDMFLLTVGTDTVAKTRKAIKEQPCEYWLGKWKDMPICEVT